MTPPGAAWLLLAFVACASALSCFHDENGVIPPDSEEEKVDTSKFKKLNCSLSNPGNVEKVRVRKGIYLVVKVLALALARCWVDHVEQVRGLKMMLWEKDLAS